MRCLICNKEKMEKVKDIIKQDRIEFEAFKCKSCGEELMNIVEEYNITSGSHGILVKDKEGIKIIPS